jgi:hypothetical protein
MSWADTSAGVMKMRNGANSAWISLYELDGTFLASDISLAAGSAAAPSLFFTGDTNTGLFSPGADAVALATAGQNRLYITSGGLVGINDASPLSRLSINVSAGSSAFFVTDASTSDFEITPGAASGICRVGPITGGMAFYTSNTEKARIDTSGRLLVGTSTARTTSTIAWSSQIETGGTLAGLGVTSNINSSSGAYLSLAKSRGSTVGSNTIVQNGDILGYVVFSGADGTDANTAGGYIGCEVDATPGPDDMPGRLVFYTTADGAASPTERMRITATGQMRLAGAGITFNGDTATANELDDYEEGTWTGTDASGAGLSITFVGGRYTKIGRLVYVSAETITYPVTANTAGATLGGLPFTNGGQNTGVAALVTTNVNANRALVLANTTTAFFYSTSTLTASTNAQLSSAIIYGFAAVYQV